jgi:hypothetical protein
MFQADGPNNLGAALDENVRNFFLKATDKHPGAAK